MTTWISAHLALVIWVALTLITFGWQLAGRTETPTGRLVLRLLTAIFGDLPKARQAVRLFLIERFGPKPPPGKSDPDAPPVVLAEDATVPSAVALGPTLRPPPPPSPKPSVPPVEGEIRARKPPSPWSRYAPLAVGAAVLAHASLGCTKQQGVQAATLTLDGILCVDQHLDDPPATLAIECGIQLTPDLVKLLGERRNARAMARQEGYTMGQKMAAASCGK